MRLYVSGPMSGMPEHNFPAFNAMAAKLRAMGHEVVNPAEYDNALSGKVTWHECMRRDVILMCDTEALVVLPGWENSKGANVEIQLARWLDLRIYTCDGDSLVSLAEHPHLLGLSGYAGSGKDTVGGMTGFTRVAFADRMREAMLALNPEIITSWHTSTSPLSKTIDEMGWDQAKREYSHIRELLQRFGTEMGRNIIHPNVWVDLALKDLVPGKRYVITDVRFPNEAQAIKDRGGFVYRIERPGIEPPNLHSSETALADWPFDGIINNSGSVENLWSETEKVLYTVTEAWAS